MLPSSLDEHLKRMPFRGANCQCFVVDTPLASPIPHWQLAFEDSPHAPH